jgi:hypothetical protein
MVHLLMPVALNKLVLLCDFVHFLKFLFTFIAYFGGPFQKSIEDNFICIKVMFS